MNYLAHAFLSFDDPHILVGNLISDFIKGKRKFDYQLEVQHGINLHRSIDAFTDTHAATTTAKSFFRKDYRLYSGPLIDIVYDHFLANDVNQFADAQALLLFSERVYMSMEKNIAVCPQNFQLIFEYMKRQNWLYHYRFNEGIENSFRGLVRRARYIDDAGSAIESFERNYAELKNCYDLFFPELKEFAAAEFERLRAGE